MERVLFSYDKTCATIHIKNVVERYVNSVNAISMQLANFGIKEVTRPLLFDTIYKGAEKASKALWEQASFMPQDPTLFGFVERKISEKIACLNCLAEKITNSTDAIYNGIAVSDPVLFDWIVIGEDGTVSLDKKREEAIIEECRVYIESEIGIRLLKLQKNVVESMQEIHDELFRIEEEGKFELDNTARFVLFHPTCLATCEIDESGRTIFTPRHVNFDPRERIILPSLED